MQRPGTPHVLVAAVVLCAGVILASAGRDEDYKIIVNPSNPVTEIERQFLRDAYLRKASAWETGAAIRPVDLAGRFRVRERFASDVLKKTASQLKSYWSQQIFSGKG